MVSHGPLARYVILRVAHAPGMPGTFSPPPQVSDPGMHHGTCVTHVPWYMPGSLTSGFLWSRWWGKRSRHFRRMRKQQFYVSGKRPMPCEKHGPRDSVDKNRGRRPRFLSLLRPEGHVFHTAWETMIKSYYSTLTDWFFLCFIHIYMNFSALK